MKWYARSKPHERDKNTILKIRILSRGQNVYQDYSSLRNVYCGTSWRDQPGSDENGDRKQLKSSLPTVEFTVGVNLSGSNISVGWATKKVYIRSDLPPNADDLTNMAMEKDFPLIDGDVVIVVADGISSITFSNRV
ncbi:hypothetical protein Goarm_022869 [Gossypium armourianum]|uniref:Uncharacterized protein n=1 Tax=Gossypium armourianum TaxID=34283 RepID=A0A7J9KDX8_9ROSI|nr:hypothetical protein [Gossypium armourianum]